MHLIHTTRIPAGLHLPFGAKLVALVALAFGAFVVLSALAPWAGKLLESGSAHATAPAAPVEPTLARTTGPLDPDYVAAREITRSKDAEPLPPTF